MTAIPCSLASVKIPLPSDHITPILASLDWLPVALRNDFKILLLTYKALRSLAPSYITDLSLP